MSKLRTIRAPGTPLGEIDIVEDMGELCVTTGIDEAGIVTFEVTHRETTRYICSCLTARTARATARLLKTKAGIPSSDDLTVLQEWARGEGGEVLTATLQEARERWHDVYNTPYHAADAVAERSER